MSRSNSLSRAAGPRRGSVLVEFALVSFALYLLMVVMLDLGRASLATQTIQSAVDTMTTELARAPLPATIDFEGALRERYVREVIYDEQELVIVIDASLDTPQALDNYFAGLPIVNQMLRPLMVRDTIPGLGAGGSGQVLLRYPGALVNTPDGGMTVVVPQIESRQWTGGQAGGYEEIRWSRVVEEVLAAGASSHFPINSGGFLAGFVNLRINYPFQAASMSAYHPDPQFWGPAHVVVADDSQVNQLEALPPGFSLALTGIQTPAGPNAGEYGLGYHFAVNQTVRPYRKVVSVHAAARREIVLPE